ncbi:putative ABC transport system permease protein [Palleronia aestuarii]|uniref:Putative ABC transport system permease protein n=1 Tax=Palleronia aestuarii TaxID=568105 RepID=A0A2W7N945_9RHOB|nr:ABC transporter permease [Palleronia aestuarii]PZX16925.1 putative ABC transport system permease protein [Palleronia aestuarii]
MASLWYGLPAWAQDTLLGLALLAPLILIALVLLPGHRPWPLAYALIRRHWGVSSIFVILIALSVALGTGLLAQERAIRSATARAADPFDLVVTAPGSELTALFATVFLRASDMGLIGGDVLEELSSDKRVALAAPLGFGDSVGDAPIVGTTADLVYHLTGGALEGRIWASAFEAVVGSDVAVEMGAHLEPAHGVGEAADDHAHDAAEFTVVGRMEPSGTPWDRAILVPIEAVWQVHGLADGHREADQVGPPFVPELVPGMPAIVVAANSLGGAYSLRAAFTRDGETMAFFPGTVLAQLYGVMGDVRGAMSIMALVSQGLVVGGVLCGLAIVARLFRRQLALLAALGAPARFVVSVMWLHSVMHLFAGVVLGLLSGQIAAGLLSSIVSRQTGLDLSAELGGAELLAVAGFLGLASLAALLPALVTPPRHPAHDLR